MLEGLSRAGNRGDELAVTIMLAVGREKRNVLRLVASSEMEAGTASEMYN